jgi:hypothetical protein
VTLGRCAELRGDTLAARDLYETADGLGGQAGEPGLTASSLEGLARISAEDDPQGSGALERKAADVRERLGRPRPHYQDTWQPGDGADSDGPGVAARAAPAQPPHPTR